MGELAMLIDSSDYFDMSYPPSQSLQPSIADRSVSSEVWYSLSLGSESPFDLYYRSDDVELVNAPETEVAAQLMPAMVKDTNLSIDGALDPRFATSLNTIQDILTLWYPQLHRISIDAPVGNTIDSNESNKKTATFFTGGMDSFYTLLKHEEQIDILVFVHGFDLELEDHVLRKKVSTSLRRIADAMGKELIEVETNLRGFSNQYTEWGDYYGAALASVAHLLRRRVRKMFVPAAQTYATLLPSGTHPLLDPLWGLETLSLVHDGCEATRIDKARVIAESEIAMQTLRVCYRNPNSIYNCGRCEKCQRTLLNLFAAGVSSTCQTFSHGLDPTIISRLDLGREAHHALMRQNLEALQSTDHSDDLVKAIHAALHPSLWRKGCRMAERYYLGARRRIGHSLRVMGLR